MNDKKWYRCWFKFKSGTIQYMLIHASNPEEAEKNVKEHWLVEGETFIRVDPTPINSRLITLDSSHKQIYHPDTKYN